MLYTHDSQRTEDPAMRVTLDEAVMNAILETLGIHAPRRREAVKRGSGGLEVKSVTLFACDGLETCAHGC